MSLLTASLLLTAAPIAHAECSWRVGWPKDNRIWTVPWGTVPRVGFVTRIECERAIDNMLREAISGQALLVELPACICVPGYDDFASVRLSTAPTDRPAGDSPRDIAVPTSELPRVVDGGATNDSPLRRTSSMFRRYNMTSDEDLRAVAERMGMPLGITEPGPSKTRVVSMRSS